jgi:hypothetical protein
LRALALALALLSSGCIRLEWNRDTRFAPVPPATLARLQPERSGLTECLAELGAPLWVAEHVHEGRAGAVLAFGWFDERDLGLRVSVPLYRSLSASFDYNQIDQRLRGAVFFFDADWRLLTWREGLLRDLTRELRRPPQPVEEEA